MTDTNPQCPRASFKEDVTTAWKVAATKICATIGCVLMVGLNLRSAFSSIGHLTSGNLISSYTAGSDISMLAIAAALALYFYRKTVAVVTEANKNPENFVQLKPETTYKERSEHYKKAIKAVLPPLGIGFGAWGLSLVLISAIPAQSNAAMFARGILTSTNFWGGALWVCNAVAGCCYSVKGAFDRVDREEAALAPPMPDINIDEPVSTTAQETPKTTAPESTVQDVPVETTSAPTTKPEPVQPAPEEVKTAACTAQTKATAPESTVPDVPVETTAAPTAKPEPVQPAPEEVKTAACTAQTKAFTPANDGGDLLTVLEGTKILTPHQMQYKEYKAVSRRRRPAAPTAHQ